MEARTGKGFAPAAQSLHESAQKYQALFDQSLDGIFLHDLDGAILDVNQAALTQSGFDKAELRAMTVFDLVVGGMPIEEILAAWRRWRPGEAVRIEGRHRRKDGTDHPVEINTGKVVIGDQELMLAIVRDITERLKAEAAREQLEQQLRHAQKMEAVGRLAGGVAHDFNNVLCGILGYTELALSKQGSVVSPREALESIRDAATRAADLTRQLLTFSRKQVAVPRVLDLSELVQSLHPMLTRVLGEDIALRTLVGAGSYPVRVDDTLIEQVVLNLAINARDAMPRGGDLLIEISAVHLDEAYCARHSNIEPGDYVMLAVNDTGVGMDAETQSKIFEPFFTTKEQGKGTGLGLATVYGIVEQSGGRVEVYSEVNRGTAFKVYLPSVAEKHEPRVRQAVRTTARGDETVLVVEDDPTVRDVAARCLEQRGYDVLATASAAEALRLAEETSRPIHLLFTDIVMPKMNGRELAARLTVARPDLRVLFSSGYTANVVDSHGMLDEGVEFIAKPYSLDALGIRVREVLDGTRAPGSGGKG